jgi:hypothetical protein
MFKEMRGYTPTWMKVLVIVWLPLAIGGAAYTISKCGFIQSLLMGDGALFAAYTGMCDD